MQLPKRDGNFFNLFEDLKPPGESKSTSKGGTSSPSNQQPIREEFVVLGYESRMFRNDKQFDSTEQFIPWMGNTDLLIDRYDARALLTDLKLFDRKAGRWDTIPRKERKPSDPKYHREQKLNKKLNKERYWDMALHMEDVYKEEKRKRQMMQRDVQATYNLAQLDYCEITKEDKAIEEEEERKRQREREKAEARKKKEDEDEEYQAPHPLPEGIIAPVLKKMGIIIEKTAHFLSNQGPEAVATLKMQQKDNSTFLFMSEGHPLNPYFKFLLGKLEEAKQQRERATEFADSLVADYNDEDEPFKTEQLKPPTNESSPAAEQQTSWTRYIAIYDFVPEREGEIGMKAGDLLLGREARDGWLETERADRRGFVPRGWVISEVEWLMQQQQQQQQSIVANDTTTEKDDQEKAKKMKRMLRAKLLTQLIANGKEDIARELCNKQKQEKRLREQEETSAPQGRGHPRRQFSQERHTRDNKSQELTKKRRQRRSDSSSSSSLSSTSSSSSSSDNEQEEQKRRRKKQCS